MKNGWSRSRDLTPIFIFIFFEKNHLGDQEIMRNERNAKEKTSGTTNTEISEADSRHREQ